MKKKLRLSFQKEDTVAVLIVLILIALSACLFFPRAGKTGGSAQVYLNGEKVYSLDLSEEGTYTVSGKYTNVISVKNGKAAIVESDCPGADCVHTGWISSAGRSIVCLPNRVEVRIADFDEVDFVVR